MDDTAMPAAGDLLVAAPELSDGNFRRSVVLICAHSEEGSFGLILNRPLPIQVRALPLDIEADATLSLGGPVQPDTLHYLHLHGGLIDDAIHVSGELYWGGDFDMARSLLEVKQATSLDLRFFVGYSGWGPGQLDEEMRQGGWFVATGLHDLTFSPQPADLWRTVLARMGGPYALLVNYPDDVRLN